MSFQLIASIGLAALPAVIWALIFLDRKDENFRLYWWIFAGGTLTVFPIFGIQLGYYALIDAFPDMDFIANMKDAISNFHIWIIILYAWVGISEEIIKFLIVRYADHTHPELIKTLSDSLKFGVLSALGFAFSENIFYFYTIWQNLGAENLLAPFLFRSTFTVCAHIIFSSLFAYFYGVSKFADDFVYFKRLRGKKLSINANKHFRTIKVAQGLIVAMGLHAVFNTLLELQQVIPVILLVAVMFLTLTFLLKRKTANLVFVLADKHRSVMQPKDIEAVMEFVGMRFNGDKYQEVVAICERLLKRDPDNNVAKLFLAKAKDSMKEEKKK